jgi:hypothetical protein
MRPLPPHPPRRANVKARTVEEALAEHGFDWDRLEKLARRALQHRMTTRRIHLDPERWQEALELYVEVGARWALEYDPDKAHGVSFATSCYRRMLPRLTDYLRRRHGDERRGTPLTTVPLADVELAHLDDWHPDLDDAVVELRLRLGEHAPAHETALRLARLMARHDLTLWEAAERLRVDPFRAAAQLDALAAALGHDADRRTLTIDLERSRQWIAA